MYFVYLQKGFKISFQKDFRKQTRNRKKKTEKKIKKRKATQQPPGLLLFSRSPANPVRPSNRGPGARLPFPSLAATRAPHVSVPSPSLFSSPTRVPEQDTAEGNPSESIRIWTGLHAA